MVMLACPNRCWTIFGCTPRPSSSVAQVWRGSCQRMSSNLARRSRGLKYLFTMPWASRGGAFAGDEYQRDGPKGGGKRLRRSYRSWICSCPFLLRVPLGRRAVWCLARIGHHLSDYVLPRPYEVCLQHAVPAYRRGITGAPLGGAMRRKEHQHPVSPR